MTVGFEWLIDAGGCDAARLRDTNCVAAVFERLIADLKLKTIGESAWHKFAGEGGVTGFVMLTESHIACHTYPEFATATFNLYCCKSRPEWNWETQLAELLGAKYVSILKIERGNPGEIIQSSELKNQAAGGGGE